MLNRTKGLVVAEELEIADSPWGRFRGLMGRRELASGTAMLIRPSSSIHTFFMRFPIDAVFVDRADRVVGVASRVSPWRLAFGGRAHAVLELPAGAAAESGIEPGDMLSFTDDAPRGGTV